MTLQRLEPSKSTWDDLVLPDDQAGRLREFVTRACQRGGMADRQQVLDRRSAVEREGVANRRGIVERGGIHERGRSSPGLTALFLGPNATGKTIAAQLLAKELGVDLYRIDLSQVASQYIGETEKNLSRLLDQTRSLDAPLFFDEADALFGRRTETQDSRDRFANVATSYLLSWMERYDGVSILATNRSYNLDKAIIRRFAIQIHFPQSTTRSM